MRKFKHKQTENFAYIAGATYAIKDNFNSIISYLPKTFIENTLDWIEIKEPLFTTADGVEMFDGDVYYTNVGTNYIGNYKTAKGEDYVKYKETRFSTRELAQDHLDFNAPKYSLCEIFGLYNKSIGRSNLIQQLKNLKK